MSTVPYAHITQGPVIVQPIGQAVVTKPRNGINPIIPICCLGLILFLIAATIVLALIPVYLAAKGNPYNQRVATLRTLYRINNGTLPVGAVTGENTATIQQDQRNFVASSNGASSSVPTVIDASVTGNTTRRRRQLEGAVGNLIQIDEFLTDDEFCQQDSCILRRAEKFQALFLGRGTFFLTLAVANGSRYVFSITAISVAILPPQNNSQSASLNNDIAILNYALVLERLEANFYTRFQTSFTAANFTAANFSQQNFDYLNIIYTHELAHVAALSAIITNLGSTPVSECTYNFSSVTDVASYIALARTLENTGTMAYDGAVNGIASPTLRQVAATIATVEARHAAYLNSISGVTPFPDTFENAKVPSVIIQAIQQFIVSCPFTITAPIVPYVGSTSFNGTIPISNNTAVSPYTDAMYTNDMNALNYALIAEQLESSFYNETVSNFTSTDYKNNGFPDASAYFILIREHEAAHVQFLRLTITQRGGTPVDVCTYNFNVANVTQFIQTSQLFENTGVKAYDGAINTISDPSLILGAATIATVEARHASYLNLLVGDVPFPNITDLTLTPTQVVGALSAFQTCPFTPKVPIVLS